MSIRKGVLSAMSSKTQSSAKVTLLGAIDPEPCRLLAMNPSKLISDKSKGNSGIESCKGGEVDDLPTLWWRGQLIFQ